MLTAQLSCCRSQATNPSGAEALAVGDVSGAPLWGRGLRMVLVAELMGRAEVTVAQLVNFLDACGHTLHGRASKVISDALRWEVRRGRVQRTGRGRYRYVGAPPSTARRFARSPAAVVPGLSL